jgi:hypothetical protein
MGIKYSLALPFKRKYLGPVKMLRACLENAETIWKTKFENT